MSKRISVFIFIVAALSFLIVGAKYAKEAGIFRKFPDAEYFSEEEARLRPAYEQLSKKEKAVYHALYEGISAKKESIPLPYEINGDTYSKLYCLVEKQESGLFYVSSTYYTAEKLRDARIAYRGEDTQQDAKEEAFRTAEKKAVQAALYKSDDYTKALAIHDYLIRHCEYTVSTENDYTSTAYGCLAEGKANCEGYAKAFRQIAMDCGLRCVLVTGVTDTGENHAWNQVEIDGEWRNIDVTWDDSDVYGDSRRLYFLCNDAEFSKTHTPENNGFKPFECGGDANDYYSRSGKSADTLSAAENIIRTAVADGQDVIDVKFTNSVLYEQFRTMYIENNRIFDILLSEGMGRAGKISVSIRENPKENCITLLLS